MTSNKQMGGGTLMPFIICFLLTGLLISGCERKEPGPAEDKAGKGGNAILRIVTKHHGKNIDSAKVYIKYNEQNTPSTYDDSVAVQVVDGKPVAIFRGLKAGKYYLLGLGWDPNIRGEVRGGLPYTIAEEKDHDISLPVTEGD